MTPDITRHTALITGASSGIGHELAREFAAHGHDVVLVARRQTALEALAEELGTAHGVSATVVPADLTAPEAPHMLHERVRQEKIPIGVLVNNAGVAFSGRFRKLDPARIDTMLALNIGAVTKLARLFVTDMVRQGHGHIMNVASTAAFQPLPMMAVYAATKAYVLSFSEALSAELAGTGVAVTALCPGFTDTEMLRKGERKTGRNEVFHKLMVMDPRQVAREGYRACMRGDPLHVTGVTNRGVATLTQLLPRAALRGLGRVTARERR
jgi:short-subunit dehydrogenase